MTDRTGGPTAPNHAHRARPENYEEDEEVYSDGEDVTHLQARAGGPAHTHGEEEDEQKRESTSTRAGNDPQVM